MAQNSTSNVTALPAMWLASARSELFSSVRRQYLQNDYFAGGLSLMILGFIANLCQAHFTALWSLFTKRFSSHVVHVKTEDQSFEWIEEWLSRHMNKDSLQVNLQTKWETEPEDNYPTTHDPKVRPRLLFVPLLLEAQTVTFQGQQVTFQLKRNAGPEEAAGSDLASLLSSVGVKDELVMVGPTRQVLEAILHEAMELHFSPEEGSQKTCIRRWNGHHEYWSLLATKLARPIGSVVLDVDIENLLSDARVFLSSRRWYADRGIPHRRGYLLYGPPGCGKTSLIQVLAGELGYDVGLVGLSSKDMDDDMLHNAMCQGNPHSIVVLEDVDAVFAQRRDGEDKSNNLSFSGLLNAIDGISAQEGRLLVMTTNHLDRLDPALIRPGRVDVRLFLGLASRSQARRLFLRFYPQASDEEADRFAEKIPEGVVSPAKLQGYFLLHRESMENAITMVADLFDDNANQEVTASVKEDPSLDKEGQDVPGALSTDQQHIEGSQPPEETEHAKSVKESKLGTLRKRLRRALSLAL